jgi:hypothetical protein
MQYIIVALLGFLIYQNYPSQVEDLSKEVNSAIHKGASKIVEVTEPTLYEKTKQKIEEITK